MRSIPVLTEKICSPFHNKSKPQVTCRRQCILKPAQWFLLPISPFKNTVDCMVLSCTRHHVILNVVKCVLTVTVTSQETKY